MSYPEYHDTSNIGSVSRPVDHKGGGLVSHRGCPQRGSLGGKHPINGGLGQITAFGLSPNSRTLIFRSLRSTSPLGRNHVRGVHENSVQRELVRVRVGWTVFILTATFLSN